MAAATLAAQILNQSVEGLVLALAPGGIAEMGLLALALGIDTAFVAAMHIFRIGVIIFAFPPIFRLLGLVPK